MNFSWKPLTEFGYIVLSKLIKDDGIVEISESKSRVSVTKAELDKSGEGITKNSTIQTSLLRWRHDGVLAQGVTTFAHELWHAFQIKMGSEIYIALQSNKDALGIKFSEIQAVGFENYIKGKLNIPGGPRLHYSEQGEKLITGPQIQ